MTGAVGIHILHTRDDDKVKDSKGINKNVANNQLMLADVIKNTPT